MFLLYTLTLSINSHSSREWVPALELLGSIFVSPIALWWHKSSESS
jgi:hypothetical protein